MSIYDGAVTVVGAARTTPERDDAPITATGSELLWWSGTPGHAMADLQNCCDDLPTAGVSFTP